MWHTSKIQGKLHEVGVEKNHLQTLQYGKCIIVVLSRHSAINLTPQNIFIPVWNSLISLKFWLPLLNV